IFIRAVPNRPENENKAGFNESEYLRSQHIFITCDYSEELRLIQKGSKSFIDNIRERLSGNLTRYIGKYSVKDETAIAKCMLLGDKTGVSNKLKEMFRGAGISHVLSVSGLHLSILFMTLSVILRLHIRTPRRRFIYAETLSCILIFIYMALANFTPSIMRAGFMLIIMNIYSAAAFYIRKFGKSKKTTEASLDEDGISYLHNTCYYDLDTSFKIGVFDSVSALFFAGAIICIISPYSVFDVGMQLSFMSTLGILISVSVLQRVYKKIRFLPLRVVIASLFVTFSAVSFTLPVCIYNFGELSTMSAVSNLLITPLMVPLLAILLVLALMSFLPQVGLVAGVCSFLGWISEIVCSVCIKIAERCSSLYFSVVTAEENLFLTLIFIVVLIFTVTCMFLGIRQMKCVGFFAILCFYFIFMTVSFLEAVSDFLTPRVNMCTVDKHPYMCVMIRDTRIVFDDLSGVASNSVMQKVTGHQIYDTNNIYLVLPRTQPCFDEALFNIMCFDKSDGIDTLLLPSKELFEDTGANIAEYSDFVTNLGEGGYNIEFYSDKFMVENVKFDIDVTDRASKVIFGDVSVIFAGEYNEEYAGKASEGCKYCIFFCDRADNTDNLGYNGDADLYVTSPFHNKIRGAKQIPVRNPEILGK
ncbi:MAG: ComEC/Rec2 family competence protein, partial [Clostridia bacterium]|nr:ComEC/Rec2 family competence protein [Clostridia bacterium]